MNIIHQLYQMISSWEKKLTINLYKQHNIIIRKNSFPIYIFTQDSNEIFVKYVYTQNANFLLKSHYTQFVIVVSLTQF